MQNDQEKDSKLVTTTCFKEVADKKRSNAVGSILPSSDSSSPLSWYIPYYLLILHQDVNQITLKPPTKPPDKIPLKVSILSNPVQQLVDPVSKAHSFSQLHLVLENLMVQITTNKD